MNPTSKFTLPVSPAPAVVKFASDTSVFLTQFVPSSKSTVPYEELPALTAVISPSELLVELLPESAMITSSAVADKSSNGP